MQLLRRFLRKRLAILGALIVILLLVSAIFAPLIAPYNPVENDLPARLQSPSLNHLLGTDNLGRDVFSRCLWGARYDLLTSLLIISISISTGVVLGGLAGYFRGKVEAVLMRLVDVLLSIPYLLFAMALSTALGGGLVNVAIALSVPTTPVYARLIFGEVVSVREEVYTDSARAIGAGNARIIVKHILPNSLFPVIIQATLDIANIIMWVSSLSFIGLGAQPPTPEWGAMISQGREHLRSAWWYPTFPGLFIFITVMGFNLLGDSVRDVFDPRIG